MDAVTIDYRSPTLRIAEQYEILIETFDSRQLDPYAHMLLPLYRRLRSIMRNRVYQP